MRTQLLYLLLAFALLSGHSLTAQWSTDTLSTPRQELAAVKVGDKLMFAGGFSFNPFGNSKQVDIYDISTGTWATDTLSEARDEMSAVSNDTLAFFVGSSGVGSISRLMDIYNVETGEWKRDTIPNAGGIKGIALSGDKVFVAGGAYVDIYDINTGDWSSKELDTPRGDITAIALGTKVLFAGGFNNGAANRVNTVDIYDTSTDTWSLDSLSVDRSGVAAVGFGNKIYMAGGVQDNYDASNRIDIYDVVTGQWSIDSMSIGRSGLVALSQGDTLYFAGGRGDNGNGTFDVIDLYSVSDGTWSTNKLTEGRHSLAGVSDGQRLFFAGGLSRTGTTNLVDIYDNSPSSTKLIAGTQARLKLYPNPCRDFVEIDLTSYQSSESLSITLLTVDGALLQQTRNTNVSNIRIDASHLAPGCYIVSVAGDGFVETKMLVKS